MRDYFSRFAVGAAIAVPLLTAAAVAISASPGDIDSTSDPLAAGDVRTADSVPATLLISAPVSGPSDCASPTCADGPCESCRQEAEPPTLTLSEVSDVRLVALVTVADDEEETAADLAKKLGPEHPATLAALKREKSANEIRQSTTVVTETASTATDSVQTPEASSGDVEAEESARRESGKEFVPTHKQVRVIEPMHDGQSVTLNTFCLDNQGNIVACVGGATTFVRANAEGELVTESTASNAFVQIYSPEGELVRETGVPFKPTAVNVAPDDVIYVAGSGKMARISADGELLVVTSTPNIGDLDEFRRKVEEDAKKQQEQYLAQFSTQLERIEKQINKLEETPEEDRPQNYDLRMKTLESQKKIYQQQLSAVEAQTATMFNSDYVMQRKLGVTGLAVTDKDVFVSLSAIQGYGYEVWRTDREFSEPEMIVDGLSGCCGQFDIQASDEKLLLAENGKFRVSIRDREGALLTSFGSRDRTGKEGFGSCCNPMNVRCCSNGDVLTAESSIGTIKRFSADGELVGVVGKAKIAGGCKHVAIGFDESRDRYYMMNVTAGHICVMLPLSEAPAMTEDEIAAKQAREGLGEQLIGEWVHERFSKSRTVTKEKSTALGGLLGALLGADAPVEEPDEVEVVGNQRQPFRFVFHDDQKLDVEGGMFANSNMQWEAVREIDESTLEVSELVDLIEYETMRIEFIEPNKAKISMMYGETPTSSGIYIRNTTGQTDDADRAVDTPAVEVESAEISSTSVPVPVTVPTIVRSRTAE